MEYSNLMYQILAFAIMSMVEKLLSVANEVMWAIENYQVFENVAKVSENLKINLSFNQDQTGANQKKNFFFFLNFISFCRLASGVFTFGR